MGLRGFFFLFTDYRCSGGNGFPEARFKDFSGTLPLQRSDRRENCPSAKGASFFPAAQRGVQGRKSFLSAKEIFPRPLPLAPYNGMIPCRFPGRSSTFPLRRSKAAIR